MPFDLKPMYAYTLFHDNWALVTAGTKARFNTCTVSWGSIGSLWGRPGRSGLIVTVYIHPARYTLGFMEESRTFTVSFFPDRYKKALAYLGAHSGRDGDKVKAAGLTPKGLENGVTFEEAELTLVCRKIYTHAFEKAGLDPEVAAYYDGRPDAFPRAHEHDWAAHTMFMGEVIAAEDRR